MICPNCKKEVKEFYFNGAAKVYCYGNIQLDKDHQLAWNYDEPDLDGIDYEELDALSITCPKCNKEVTEAQLDAFVRKS
jgi:phage FluMu protein Com